MSHAMNVNYLGIGIYTPSEAAMYARLSPLTMSRWLFGGSRGRAVFDPQLGQDDKLVTFLDFVQALAIRSIRLTRPKIQLEKIREAIQLAEDRGHKYPLARRHKIFILSNDVVINIGDEDLPQFIQASGKFKNNRIFTQVAELYARDIGYDDADGLASSYLAHRFEECKVMMNPKIRLGEPMIETCGYSAQALWDAYRSEGGVDQAAKAYDVKPVEVMAAVSYFDQIIQRSAA